MNRFSYILELDMEHAEQVLLYAFAYGLSVHTASKRASHRCCMSTVYQNATERVFTIRSLSQNVSNISCKCTCIPGVFLSCVLSIPMLKIISACSNNIQIAFDAFFSHVDKN